ncbi:hypothetical protein B4915_12405 [Leucobacter massiliensis]|uniref:Uncharacterized protein n=1 Tax=Leucobacter massiliensis TaxID=1686285 RepID=A0A2S9QKU3_9MICO|nr:hypothetical protein B4915_12405 [Leucobacter massiliensis]
MRVAIHAASMRRSCAQRPSPRQPFGAPSAARPGARTDRCRAAARRGPPRLSSRGARALAAQRARRAAGRRSREPRRGRSRRRRRAAFGGGLRA